MVRAAFLFFALLPFALAQAQPSSAAPGPSGSAARPPPCDVAQLSFAVDRQGGYFDGMSQSGTLLVVRNLGPQACSVPARPELIFMDAHGKPLPVSARQQPGMHPGPVILPVAVPPGAELTSEARWVSSDAYGANNCVEPQSIALSLGGQSLVAPLKTRLCGPAGQSPAYTATLLHRDPPLKATGP
jgi:hypothetical protein